MSAGYKYHIGIAYRATAKNKRNGKYGFYIGDPINKTSPSIFLTPKAAEKAAIQYINDWCQ